MSTADEMGDQCGSQIWRGLGWCAGMADGAQTLDTVPHFADWRNYVSFHVASSDANWLLRDHIYFPSLFALHSLDHSHLPQA